MTVVRRALPGRRVLRTGLVLALALALLMVASAIAGNMSFQSGGTKIGSVIFDGVVVGIGNEFTRVLATANARVTLECTNKGLKAAPGRNLIEVEVPESGIFPTDENGRAEIHLVVEDPILGDIQPSPSPKQAGCPNGNWKVSEVIDVFWTTVTVEAIDTSGVTQDALFFDCTDLTNPGDICPEVTG